MMQRKASLSRQGRAGIAARRAAMLDDITRRWSILRVGTWIDPTTGTAARWIIRANGEPKPRLSLEVNGRTYATGGERTIRAALARAMWTAERTKQREAMA